ncbi:hypothetical protein [Pseudomonas aeruginosa]|uniref:hypothetical protein n=1 Tax=Pseudomonas aeruginosa TaxID=287 RepID=UPI0039195D15
MQLDGFDLEAALVLNWLRTLGGCLSPRKLLELLDALALLFEQALLAITNQITISRQRLLGDRRGRKKANKCKKRGELLLTHRDQSLARKAGTSISKRRNFSQNCLNCNPIQIKV